MAPRRTLVRCYIDEALEHGPSLESSDIYDLASDGWHNQASAAEHTASTELDGVTCVESPWRADLAGQRRAVPARGDPRLALA